MIGGDVCSKLLRVEDIQDRQDSDGVDGLMCAFAQYADTTISRSGTLRIGRGFVGAGMESENRPCSFSILFGGILRPFGSRARASFCNTGIPPRRSSQCSSLLTAASATLSSCRKMASSAHPLQLLRWHE